MLLYDDPAAYCPALDEFDDGPPDDLFKADFYTSPIGQNLKDTGNGSAPKASAWKTQTNEMFFVEVDQGRSIAMSQATSEVRHVFQRCRDLKIFPEEGNLEGREHSESRKEYILQGLFDNFLGANSRVFSVFRQLPNGIGHDASTFTHFIATFLSTVGKCQSREDLKMDPLINDEMLMGVDMYKLYWNAIGNAKMPDDINRSAGIEPFWLELEKAINNVLKELMIANFNEKMTIVIDDDKMHYQIRKVDPGAPKTMQHTRDNRKGFVQHEAVAAASQLMVGKCYIYLLPILCFCC